MSSTTTMTATKPTSAEEVKEYETTWDHRDDLYMLEESLSVFATIKEQVEGWDKRRVRDLLKADIDSTEKLEMACRQGTINLLLAQAECETLAEITVVHLDRFLPGPTGRSCYRLAQEAVERVEAKTAKTKYVHRANKVKVEKEIWDVTTDTWTMHVDCAGFIRNVLGTILDRSPFIECLSDRPFMRAKDFFTYFEKLPNKITDLDTETSDWRRVDDLRRLLPGDIICYRIEGRAAGGAVFTNKEDESAKVIFTALKTAQYYEAVDEEEGIVTRNLARDETVKEWVAEVCKTLEPLGITDYWSLKKNMNLVKELLEKIGEGEDTIELLEEVMESQHKNTGHIMVCAGHAEQNATNPNEFRIPVYHSTKSAKNPGVQRGYKRIVTEDFKTWKRNVGDVDVSGDHDVIVVAARLCF